jgi:hypothetical protein
MIPPPMITTSAVSGHDRGNSNGCVQIWETRYSGVFPNMITLLSSYMVLFNRLLLGQYLIVDDIINDLRYSLD